MSKKGKKGGRKGGHPMDSMEEVLGEMPATLFQAVQAMMDDVNKSQDELGEVKVEGLAGGGLVKIHCTATGEYTGVKIDESLLKENVSVIEDLVLAAISDASDKVKEAQREFHFCNEQPQPIAKLIHRFDR